jgi:hypothetical protein
MFRLRPSAPGEGNLKHGWAERSLDRVIQLGQYGIHFVPPPPDTASLKSHAEDPRTLQRILAQTDFEGVVILDTKSDLGRSPRRAHAADLLILPVADWGSLRGREDLPAPGAGPARAVKPRLLTWSIAARVDAAAACTTPDRPDRRAGLPR